MAKQKIPFARHRSNGFVVDLVREGLDFSVESLVGVVVKDWQRLKKGVVVKYWQRLKKEDSITSEHYSKILQAVCNALIKELFSLDDEQMSEQDKREIEFFVSLVREFLSYFSQYKSYVETLGAGQKQLDFITVAVFFVPFLSHAISSLGSIKLELLSENERIKAQQKQIIEPFIVDRILPDSSKSAFQKVFELIEMENYKEILQEIFFDSAMERNTKSDADSGRRKIFNWLNAKSSPSLKNIKQISKLSEHRENLSCRKIEILLKIARLSQSLYDKAKDYFGEDLANLLVEHFRLITTIDVLEQHLLTLLKIGESGARQEFERLQEIKIRLYIHSLYDCGTDRVKLNGMYDRDLSERERQKFETMQTPLSMTLVNEKDFFENINAFLVTRFFVPQNSDENGLKQNAQEYGQARLKAFLNPNKDEIKKMIDKQIDLCEFKNKDVPAFCDDTELLGELTAPITIKDNENEKKVLELFKRLENKYDELDKNPFVCFLKARFYAQKLELEKANEYYLKALEFGKNVLGRDFATVVKEGLMVSAQLTDKIKLDLSNAKSHFTKFYKEAYFTGLITDLPDKKEEKLADFNQYLLLQGRMKFQIHFWFLYPNANQQTIKQVTFANTSLMKSCNRYDINFAEKILATKDAQVDALDDNNASALHYCIPDFGFIITLIMRVPQMPSHIINLAKKLIEKCSLETLNARTILERQTILSRCIRWGLVDLVELLIKKGVDLDSKNCCVENDLPINYCLNFIEAAKSGVPNGSVDMYQGMTKDDIKNYKRMSGALFDDDYSGALEQERLDRQRHPNYDFTQEICGIYYKQKLKDYLKIAELIIDKMQNINVRQERLDDITPLMNATDIDEPILVKRLLARGADKGLKDENGKTAYDYAKKNHNSYLMKVLRV